MWNKENRHKNLHDSVNDLYPHDKKFKDYIVALIHLVKFTIQKTYIYRRIGVGYMKGLLKVTFEFIATN
jgi:hypothetical protein